MSLTNGLKPSLVLAFPILDRCDDLGVEGSPTQPEKPRPTWEVLRTGNYLSLI